MGASPERELFPDAFCRFVALFNRGRFWESHEVLELPWRQNRSPFYKGMIIYASAFVHAQRGNPIGVRKQLVKARRYLTGYAPFYLGVDVAGLLEHVEACLAVVGGPDPPSGPALVPALPAPSLALSPERLRGDEGELAT